MLIINAYLGQKIRIQDRTLHAVDVRSPGLVEVQVDGDTETCLVSWDRKLEILPGVKVTVDRGLEMAPRVKFLFDAPRSVRIRELPHETAP